MNTHVQLEAEGSTREQLEKLFDLFPSGDLAHIEDFPAGDQRNAFRASLAAKAVLAYDKRCQPNSEEPLEQVVRDLISDLMHLCDLLRSEHDDEDDSFDYMTLASVAYTRYEEEADGE